jgi:hypothetical protein
MNDLEMYFEDRQTIQWSKEKGQKNILILNVAEKKYSDFGGGKRK